MQGVISSGSNVAALMFASMLFTGCGSAGDSGGTFDNTGGAPPPGNSIGFEPVSVTVDAQCTSLFGNQRLSVLARGQTDIPVVDGNESCVANLGTALAAVFASLGVDQAIGIFTLSHGGCVRSYEVARVMRDGLVIRPWILLHDTTLGARAPVACTADVIPGVYALRVDGAAGANSMQLHLGRVNPNYPRDSAVPMF